MTKTELIGAVAEKAGLSKTDADAAIKAFTDSVTAALADSDKVTLVGFGTFSLGHRAARTGRNPKTGAELQIAARNTAKFKAAKQLKGAL